jgi:hypothetical protein
LIVVYEVVVTRFVNALAAAVTAPGRVVQELSGAEVSITIM